MASGSHQIDQDQEDTLTVSFLTPSIVTDITAIETNANPDSPKSISPRTLTSSLKDSQDITKKMSQENTIEPHNQTENSEINASSSSNPFAYTAKDLSLFFTPQIKDFSVLKKFGGIDGLIKGLHTDSQAGLSSDEIALLKPISLKEITKDSDVVDVSTESEQSSTDDVQPPGPAPVEGTPFYQRISVFGRNILPERKSKSIFELMWIAMQDKILILLTIAAVVSLALGLYEDFGVKENHEPGQPKIRWVEGVAIIIAILIVVLVGSLNDWQKERRFQKLNARKEDRNVKVMRNGKEALLSVHDILVGDVLFLEPGDIIATDGVLISGHNLRCDESAATGESDAVKKVKYEDCLKLENEGVTDHKVDPFILSGSKVLEGVGTYLVTGIGVNSFYGKILMSLRGEAEDTPLQEKLNDLAEKIAKLGGAAALLMFIVLLIKYFVGFRNGVPSVTDAFDRLIKIIISTITVVVVAVPEGLPLAVTLALSYATIRMLKDNNLVRVLSACETMGNATTICSDKTGTLTQNKMTVVAGVVGSTVAFVRDVDAHSAHSEEPPQSTELALLEKPISLQEINPALPKDILQLLNESIAINSTAFEGDLEDGKRAFIGSKTETALLSFLLDLKLDNIKSLRENAQIAQVFPFNSERKSMGVAIKVSDSKWRFYVKGASEIILKKTGSIVNIIKSDDGTPTGSVMNLTQDRYDNVLSIIENYATRSLRTIGLAYREFEQWPPKEMTKNDDDEVPYEELFDKLTLLGIVGIEDPLREGVREAVKHCISAGVKVRMVTGDNILTAKSIATQCGIFTGGVVMEGPVFRNLSDEQMDQMLPKLQVLARSSPDDKRILVGRLKKLGDTVAVTGDGTNDGPALKLSDVGFSMGIAGTEVAKEASSIILMDDNFSSIVKAILWGRNVNDAVKKFLQFQLTVNVTAVLLTFITAVSSNELQSVLSAVQLLWVNLIMDTFAALALATDPPTWDLLDRKPEPRSAPLISLEMWKMIIGQSIFQLVITLLLFYAGDAILGYDTPAERGKKQTVIFNTFVFFQIFNEINCRRLDGKINVFKGALANRFLLIISVIMIVGQILIVQFGGAAFQVEPIDIIQWLICVGLGFLSLPVGVIIRLIPIENFRISSTSPEVDVDLEKDWNDAIKQVQSQLKIFKTLRGGRFRAHFGDRKEKSEKRSKAFMAAAMLPSLISASVGVQLRENTGDENNENIKAEDQKLSEKQNASEQSENPNAPEKSENQNAPEEKPESQNVDKIEVQ